MERKRTERMNYLKKRDALSVCDREKKSKRICDTLCKMKEYQQASDVFCYVSFRSEVITEMLLERIIMDQKRLYVPRVTGREMEFYEIRSLEELRPGAFGILEPWADRQSSPRVRSQIPSPGSLMILPGAAFDLKGRRLGYGGGYYDRYLQRYPKCHRIGLAYELQIAESLPQESTDIAVETVITESRIYRCESGKDY